MRTRTALSAACLLLLTVSGTAYSSTDGPPSASPAADKRGSEAAARLGGAAALPACSFSDVAYSDTFRAEGLGYVTSAEFAAALRAVVNGDSKYSPAEIPQSWRVAAAEWDGSRPGLERLKALGDRGSNIPALIYLASMEYRWKARRPQLKPAYPVLVRAATRDLEGRVAAKQQLAGRFAERMDAIGVKLYEAELMGAAGCAPGAVADAKAELDMARRGVTDVRSSVQDTESSLLKAERFAEMLVVRQRFASQRGLKCYAE